MATVTKYSQNQGSETIYDRVGTLQEMSSAWNNLSSIEADDTYNAYSDAYCKTQGSGTSQVYYIEGTNLLTASNFGFTIPPSAQITALSASAVIRVGKSSPFVHPCQFTVRDNTTYLAQVSPPLSTSEATTTVGVNPSLLTPDMVNSSTFNVTFRKLLEVCTAAQYYSYAGAFRVYVDYIRIAVTYSCPYNTCEIQTVTIDSTASYGHAYSQLLNANTGTGTTWSILAGTLPVGLTLGATTGVISGTPTALGSSTFTVLATYNCDATLTDSQEYTIDVSCEGYYASPPTALPTFVQGTAYTDGGTTVTLSSTPAGTKTWTIVTGALPTGVSLNETTGAITGTPSAVGSWVGSITFKCTWADGCLVSFTVPGEYSVYKTKSDSVDGVTGVVDSASKSVGIAAYESAANNAAWVFNMKTGDWTFIDNAPFSSGLYRADDNSLIATRRDTSAIAKFNTSDTFDGTAIAASFQTGFMDFGDLDEVKEMPPQFSEALKRVRAFFCDLKANGNLTLTVYTDQNSTGVSFTITPATTDNVVYNAVRTALSRDLRGKYISLKVENVTGSDFWMGEVALKVQPRNIR